MVKFLKCTNPAYNHIKMAYGKMLEEWPLKKCDCGYPFEGFIDLANDVASDQMPAFEDVDPKADTKILPTIKQLTKKNYLL